MSRRTEKADELDNHIGKYIRERRENLGMTQTDLAMKAQVSYQQIHKYEQGANRISASRLGMIAKALQLSVQEFYDSFAHGNHMANQTAESRLCLEVARNFRMINNPRYREALHLLVRILADETILS
jgi:transcriptional regulator with XRE-family HTH domain